MTTKRTGARRLKIALDSDLNLFTGYFRPNEFFVGNIPTFIELIEHSLDNSQKMFNDLGSDYYYYLVAVSDLDFLPCTATTSAVYYHCYCRSSHMSLT